MQNVGLLNGYVVLIDTGSKTLQKEAILKSEANRNWKAFLRTLHWWLPERKAKELSEVFKKLWHDCHTLNEVYNRLQILHAEAHRPPQPAVAPSSADAGSSSSEVVHGPLGRGPEVVYDPGVASGSQPAPPPRLAAKAVCLDPRSRPAPPPTQPPPTRGHGPSAPSPPSAKPPIRRTRVARKGTADDAPAPADVPTPAAEAEPAPTQERPAKAPRGTEEEDAVQGLLASSQQPPDKPEASVPGAPAPQEPAPSAPAAQEPAPGAPAAQEPAPSDLSAHCRRWKRCLRPNPPTPPAPPGLPAPSQQGVPSLEHAEVIRSLKKRVAENKTAQATLQAEITELKKTLDAKRHRDEEKGQVKGKGKNKGKDKGKDK